ncbi:unnamed protein product, partial [Prorocentrum cordatum]
AQAQAQAQAAPPHGGAGVGGTSDRAAMLRERLAALETQQSRFAALEAQVRALAEGAHAPPTAAQAPRGGGTPGTPLGTSPSAPSPPPPAATPLALCASLQAPPPPARGASSVAAASASGPCSPQAPARPAAASPKQKSVQIQEPQQKVPVPVGSAIGSACASSEQQERPPVAELGTPSTAVDSRTSTMSTGSRRDSIRNSLKNLAGFAATGLGGGRRRASLRRSSCEYEEEEPQRAPDHLPELPEGPEESLGHDSTEPSDPEDDDDDDSDADSDFGREMHRRGSVSAEAHGAWNMRRVGSAAVHFSKATSDRDMLMKALKSCPFFQDLNEETLTQLVDSMPVEPVEAGECVVKQGEQGDAAFAILSGSMNIYNEDSNTSCRRTVVVGTTLGAGPMAFVKKKDFIRQLPAGRLFGEMSMLWGSPRSRSVYASEPSKLARLSREAYLNIVVRYNEEERQRRVKSLKKASMLETLDNEEIAQIADALEKRRIKEGDYIVKQGEEGDEFFVIMSGVCVVTVASDVFKGDEDVQEYRSLGPGDLFGEIALLKRTKRTASIQARSDMQVLCLKRRQFERMFGKLEKLQQKNYVSDPRRCLAEFFLPGDATGPKGMCKENHAGQARSDWFAVYRPTSRDAIALMIRGAAVGKGLNVKGKSAKRNRLSGFVPFLQISDNKHKCKIEPSPPDARLRIFYVSEADCLRAKSELEAVAHEPNLEVTDRSIFEDTSYVHSSPPVWGLDVPEPVMREAYIMRPDITFMVGWETGRASEPAFMDMNLHAIRDKKPPRVVLYQYDVEDPMNPQGLLIAYAEACVKPVVSDFDTFTVGSKGMTYHCLAGGQAELSAWSLRNTLDILRSPSGEGWCGRWLDVLRQADEHILRKAEEERPQYGYGDDVSYRLISEVVQATSDTGAVRHGAECFNFFFPQELDPDYLVVYPELDDKPWAYMNELELRNFLSDRIQHGYIFPMNPVWLVRDEGWYDLYEEMRQTPEGARELAKWFGPPGSGIAELIEEIHSEFPEGFRVDKDSADNSQHWEAAKGELDSCELAALATHTATGMSWSKLRSKVRTLQKLGGLSPKAASSSASTGVSFALQKGDRLAAVAGDAGLAETGASPD